jgi:peptidoglycan hydrolase CwlO-like protein
VRVLLAVGVLATLAVAASPVRADTKSDLKASTNRLSDLITRIQTASAELSSLRGQIAALLAEVDANRRALEQTNAAIDTSQQQASGLQAQIDAEQAALDTRAVQAYEQGPGEALVAILDASSFTDLQGRMETLQIVANTDDELIRSLQARRAGLASARSDLKALQRRIDQVQARLAQMVTALRTAVSMQENAVTSLQSDKAAAESLIAHLKAKRERELAQQALVRAAGAVPQPGPPPPGTQAVRDMIVWYFSPMGQRNVDLALCVGYRESRYQADAVNTSSGASGVFQFMPFLWPIVSKAAGWGGASVFDAKANVAVASWTVANYGWSPWNSDSDVCPI